MAKKKICQCGHEHIGIYGSYGWCLTPLINTTIGPDGSYKVPDLCRCNKFKPKESNMIEGMAEVVDPIDGLKKGEYVYIKQIPGQGNTCVVIRNGFFPIVGLHIDRFNLLK